jgi:hypothetical protein
VAKNLYVTGIVPSFDANINIDSVGGNIINCAANLKKLNGVYV